MTQARASYSTEYKLRSEFPTLETQFGTMAYWRSLELGKHGRYSLGGFEPPYTPDSPGSDKTITVNKVEYSGSVYVYLDRDKNLRLDFSSLHRAGDWRSSPTASAQTKLEAELLPLAKELFPLPTDENYAAMIFDHVQRSIYSGASSAIHSLSTEVWYDTRYRGHAAVISEAVQYGLDRVKESAASERFETTTR